MPERLRNRLVARVLGTLEQFPETRGLVMRVEVPGIGTFPHAEGSCHPSGTGDVATGDIVRVASVSKTFAALAELTLLDEGRVGVDNPVPTCVPSCPNGVSITVPELLGKTSGLAD